MLENEEKIESTAETAEEKVEEKVEETVEEKVEEPCCAEGCGCEKKKKLSGGLLGAIIAGGVVVLAAIAAVVVFFIFTNNAKAAYTAKDYEKAYENSKFALFLDQNSKNLILEKYVVEVLGKNGDYYRAAALIQESALTEEKKTQILSSNANFALCVKGQTVKYGIYSQDTDFMTDDELEWLVLDVVEENGRAKALIMTKKIIGGTGTGFVNKKHDTFTYDKSAVHEWCEKDFLITFSMSFRAEKDRFLNTLVTTEGNSGEPVQAHVFVLSKAELSKYMTGDLAQQIKAECTAYAATEEGGSVTKSSNNFAGYFLRDAGTKDGTVTGISRAGELETDVRKNEAYGIRPCMWIDLGAI